MELQCSKLQPRWESRLLFPDFDAFGADVCGRGDSGRVADRTAIRQFELHPDRAAAYGTTGGGISGVADCGTDWIAELKRRHRQQMIVVTVTGSRYALPISSRD